MTKKKAAPAPRRAKAKAVESTTAKPAVTSVQRQHQERKDLESTRTRGQRRRFNKNLTVMDSEVPKNALKVRATQTGYYDHLRRRPGDVFLIDATKLEEDVKNAAGKVTRKKGEVAAFSSRWMELVDPKTPESVSTANDAIRQQHDELLASRYGDGGPVLDHPDNVDDVDDDHGNPLGE